MKSSGGVLDEGVPKPQDPTLHTRHDSLVVVQARLQGLQEQAIDIGLNR